MRNKKKLTKQILDTLAHLGATYCSACSSEINAQNQLLARCRTCGGGACATCHASCTDCGNDLCFDCVYNSTDGMPYCGLCWSTYDDSEDDEDDDSSNE